MCGGGEGQCVLRTERSNVRTLEAYRGFPGKGQGAIFKLNISLELSHWKLDIPCGNISVLKCVFRLQDNEHRQKQKGMER